MEKEPEFSLWSSLKETPAAEIVYAFISAALLYGSVFMAFCFCFGVMQ